MQGKIDPDKTVILKVNIFIKVNILIKSANRNKFRNTSLFPRREITSDSL